MDESPIDAALRVMGRRWVITGAFLVDLGPRFPRPTAAGLRSPRVSEPRAHYFILKKR
jgi:hypothetical protein